MVKPAEGIRWFATLEVMKCLGEAPVQLKNEHSFHGLTVAPLGPILKTQELWRVPTGSAPEKSPIDDRFTKNEVRTGFELGVIGVVPGTSWDSVLAEINQTIFDLACLLSATWSCCVSIGDPPYQPLIPTDARDVVSETEGFRHSDLPEGFGAAWQLVQGAELTRGAVHMFAQGMQLSRSHPSMAYVAFITALEAVGQTLLPTQNCAGYKSSLLYDSQGTELDCSDIHCEECQKTTGAMAAFEAAVTTVIAPEKARSMKKTAYAKRRSATTHNGELHGADGGVHEYWPISGDPETFFFELARISRIASQVILKQLALA